MLGPDGAKVGSWPLLDRLSLRLNNRPTVDPIRSADKPPANRQRGAFRTMGFSEFAHSPQAWFPLFGFDSAQPGVGGDYPRHGTGLRPWPPCVGGSGSGLGPPLTPRLGVILGGPKPAKSGPPEGPIFPDF